MALLFTEGFDWTTTLANYANLGKWSDQSGGAIGNNSSFLRFGSGSGNYFNDGASRASYMRRAFGSNLASGVLGIALRIDTSVNANPYKMNIFTLFDTTANAQMGLSLDNNRTLFVYRTSHANILGTSTATIPVNQWSYIELKWKIANSISSGDVEVYVDGTLVLTIAAASDTQNTANAYATHYAFSGNAVSITDGGNCAYYFDDHYCLDLTGSVNNAPLGNCRIQTLYPNANGNSSQFTGSDGNSVNNFQQVDETDLNTGDYNDGTTLNHKDTYGHTDTVTATSVVYGLTVNQVALRTDTDARSICPVIRHSGTDYDGGNKALGASAAVYQTVYETNPGTTAAWTKSDVDGAEFGTKVSV